MAEERITQVETPTGAAHTHTTVVTDGSSRGSGATWLLVIVAILAVLAAVWLFSGMSGSEVAKDNAIANAAGEVGDAAQQAGNAVESAAERVTPN